MRYLGVLALCTVLQGCSGSSPATPAVDLAHLPAARTIRANDPISIGSNWEHSALYYFPNRLLDLFDVIRFGVDIGPGIGIDAAFSQHARFAAMYRHSLGLGYQTFRHQPMKNFSMEQYNILGPHSYVLDGIAWYEQEWDFRLELHLLVVGAHACVNPFEIGDFFMGWFMVDPADDDY
jgi:hypothetical protein